MIGQRPCAYACAYVDPVLTGQSCGISVSLSTRTNMFVLLVEYDYAYVKVITQP